MRWSASLFVTSPGRARNAVSQLRKGTLEYCYPLLSRLRRDHLVSTSWQESEAGPPRRYYQLTDAGKRALADFSDEWARFRNAVDALVTTQGEQDDEHAR